MIIEAIRYFVVDMMNYQKDFQYFFVNFISEIVLIVSSSKQPYKSVKYSKFLLDPEIQFKVLQV